MQIAINIDCKEHDQHNHVHCSPLKLNKCVEVVDWLREKLAIVAGMVCMVSVWWRGEREEATSCTPGHISLTFLFHMANQHVVPWLLLSLNPQAYYCMWIFLYDVQIVGFSYLRT